VRRASNCFSFGLTAKLRSSFRLDSTSSGAVEERTVSVNRKFSRDGMNKMPGLGWYVAVELRRKLDVRRCYCVSAADGNAPVAMTTAQHNRRIYRRTERRPAVQFRATGDPRCILRDCVTIWELASFLDYFLALLSLYIWPAENNGLAASNVMWNFACIFLISRVPFCYNFLYIICDFFLNTELKTYSHHRVIIIRTNSVRRSQPPLSLFTRIIIRPMYL